MTISTGYFCATVQYALHLFYSFISRRRASKLEVTKEGLLMLN